MADHRRLCIIPARAGSKGVPHKNVRDFLGKPLIAYSIEQALASGLFDEVAVTSDSDDYLRIAGRAGATQLIKRPETLASDSADSISVLLHALETVERDRGETFTAVCLLQATSPVRPVEKIVEAIERLEGGDLDSVFSVCAAKASPYFNLVERDASGLSYGLSKALPRDVTRRQDAPAVYQINGSIYVWRRDALVSHKRTLCPKSEILQMGFLESVDIDTETDWAFAELAMKLHLETKIHLVDLNNACP